MIICKKPAATQLTGNLTHGSPVITTVACHHKTTGMDIMSVLIGAGGGLIGLLLGRLFFSKALLNWNRHGKMLPIC